MRPCAVLGPGRAPAAARRRSPRGWSACRQHKADLTSSRMHASAHTVRALAVLGAAVTAARHAPRLPPPHRPDMPLASLQARARHPGGSDSGSGRLSSAPPALPTRTAAPRPRQQRRRAPASQSGRRSGAARSARAGRRVGGQPGGRRHDHPAAVAGRAGAGQGGRRGGRRGPEADHQQVCKRRQGPQPAAGVPRGCLRMPWRLLAVRNVFTA